MGEQCFEILQLIPSIPELILIFETLMILAPSNCPVVTIKGPEKYAVCGSLDNDPIVTKIHSIRKFIRLLIVVFLSF